MPLNFLTKMTVIQFKVALGIIQRTDFFDEKNILPHFNDPSLSTFLDNTQKYLNNYIQIGMDVSERTFKLRF